MTSPQVTLTNRVDAWVNRHSLQIGAIGGWALAALAVRASSLMAGQVHPLLGAGVALIWIGLGIWLTRVLWRARKSLGRTSIWSALGSLALLFMLLTQSFACLAYALQLVHVAEYSSAIPVDPGILADHYFWHVLDVLPGLRVWETLGVEDRVIEANKVAGLILICFRLLVILPLFGLVKAWWDSETHRPGGIA